MTETREIDGKTYQVTDGKIIAPDGKMIDGYAGILDAPRPLLEAARKKGIDLTGRVYYGGYFVWRELAEIAEAQKIRVRQDKQQALEAAVPGYHELSAAINDQIRYREEFSRMMEDEDNDGVRPPRQPNADVDALRQQYPVAAAYIQAESWSCAAHDVKVTCGRRAMEAIRQGQDPQQAIREMEEAWSQWCMEHVD